MHVDVLSFCQSYSPITLYVILWISHTHLFITYNNQWVATNMFWLQFNNMSYVLCTATLGLVITTYILSITQTQCTAYISNNMCTHLGLLIKYYNSHTSIRVTSHYMIVKLTWLFHWSLNLSSLFTSSMIMNLQSWRLQLVVQANFMLSTCT